MKEQLMEAQRIDTKNDVLKGSEKSAMEAAYYLSIDECAKEGRNQFIENSMQAHATYLMVKLFQNAAQAVRLFSGSMGKVYASPELIKEAIAFLQKSGSSLNIVLENDIDGGHPDRHPLIAAINSIKEHIKGTVIVRKLSDDFKITDRKHFMVMDSKAYRVEYDHDNTKAIANFGDAERATEWVNYFDNVLVKKSSVIYEAHIA